MKKFLMKEKRTLFRSALLPVGTFIKAVHTEKTSRRDVSSGLTLLQAGLLTEITNQYTVT